MPEPEAAAGIASKASRSYRRPIILSAGIFSLALFYFLTSPGNRTEADDAFWFAWDVEVAPWPELFDPLHLLFLPFGRVVWQALQGVGGPARAYPVLVATGALATATAVFVAWDLLVRRLGIGSVRAALAAALLGLSYGVWRYSAEAEVYGLALAVTAGVSHFALAAEPGRMSKFGVVALAALAPLVHILAIVVSAVAVPVAIISRRGWRPAVRYAVATLALGSSLGFVGYQLAGAPEGGLLRFYSAGEATRPEVDFEALARHGAAASQVLVSGNFLLIDSSMRRHLQEAFPDRMLEDEIFAGANAPAALLWIGSITLLTVIASFVWLLAAGRRHAISRARSATVRLAAVWLALLVATAVTFSRAGQPEVWMLAVFPAWLMLSGIVISSELPLAPLVALATALLLHNGIAGLGVYASKEGDRHRAGASWLIDNAGRSDVILTARGAGFARYLDYWSPAQVLDLQFRTPEEIRRALLRAQCVSGRTFATLDIFDPPRYYGVLRPELADSLRRITAAVRTEFDEVATDPIGPLLERRPGDHGTRMAP